MTDTIAPDPAPPVLRRRGKRLNGASYEHPLAFWIGVTITTIGVLLQLPSFFMAHDMRYHLAGMPVTVEMAVGMVLLVVGVGITTYSLFPRRSSVKPKLSRVSITPLDDAAIRPESASSRLS